MKYVCYLLLLKTIYCSADDGAELEMPLPNRSENDKSIIPHTKDSLFQSHSGWVTLASKKVGDNAVLVDDGPVLQIFGRGGFSNGVYVSVLANHSLRSDNPNRSKEVDLATGIAKQVGNYFVDASIAINDVENPNIGDFDGDVIASKLHVDYGNSYVETIRYDGIGIDNGWLFGAGHTLHLSEQWSVNGKLNYTNGPNDLDKATSIKSIITYKPINYPVSVYFEFTDLLYRQADDDIRKFAALTGVRYHF